MSRAFVAVATSSFGAFDRRPIERLEQAGYEVRLNPHGRRLRREEAIALLDGAVGIVAGTETLDREVLSRATTLRVVSRCGTGTDNVDLAAAAELGIAVERTPEAPVDAVAELALAGILAVLRQVATADRTLRGGGWEKPMGRLLAGKTVGLVGFGRVGRRLAELLAPFGVRLLACDPTLVAGAGGAAAEILELEELLAASDVVSLHAAPPAGDPPILDRRCLGLMKEDAVLANTARGGLVDEEALSEMLAAGRLGGAYLDVFRDEPYDGPLRDLPNVLLTPHIGSYAVESRIRMELEAVENLVAALAKIAR